ncbi:MAG: alginate export family protein [Bryobacteraceae bacterium]|nr:alginate export family protein [Bryobacteraceae bacterium]
MPDTIHAVIGHLQFPGTLWEPFGLWKLSPRVRSESGSFGKQDIGTYGLRLAGSAGKQNTYVSEMAYQSGNWGADSVSTWAGHWRIVRTLQDDLRWPTLRLEYDYARGDSDPSDGRHHTFELLYPTPHDKYGLADQIGWKNIHHISSVAEWSRPKKTIVQLKYHSWWLASKRDGVYNAGGNLLARDPLGLSGRHIGQELDLQILGGLGTQIKLGGGIGHIFPGRFLNNTTPGGSYTFPYVMLTWAF